MQIEFTSRGLLSVFFRQYGKFLMVFLACVLGGVLYLDLAKPQYEAGGSLLVKFGHDARPEIARPDSRTEVISQDDRRETIQSDMDILQSHNLLLSLVREFDPEKMYPGITARVEGADRPEEAAVRRLLENDLTVKANPQSNLIEVRLVNEDPQLAAQFVHRLFETFIIRQSEVYGKPQTDFLRDQVQQAAAKLERSQQQFKDFKLKNGISSIEEELSALLQQKSDAGTVSLDSIDDAWTRLADLQAKETQILATYQPGSPQVEQIKKSVALAEKQLRRRQADLAARTGRATAGIDARIAALEDKRAQYNNLMRQVDIDEENYKRYQLRGEDMRVNEMLNQKNITPIAVVDEPVAPMKPVRPRRLLTIAMCLLAGSVFGLGAALAWETFDPRFTTPEQVSLALGVPVMAGFNA